MQDSAGAMASDKAKEEFRLHPAIRWIVRGAIWFWVVILMVLLFLPAHVPWHTYASSAFFIALFSLVLLFYSGLTIVADQYGVTYRGLLSFRTYPYETIMKVDARQGITGIVNYNVITRRGMLYFSSFIADHRRLMELIVARASLAGDRRPSS